MHGPVPVSLLFEAYGCEVLIALDQTAHQEIASSLISHSQQVCHCDANGARESRPQFEHSVCEVAMPRTAARKIVTVGAAARLCWIGPLAR